MDRPDIRVILGRGGTGKSYLVRHQLTRLRCRALIFDPKCEREYGNDAVIATTPDELVIAMLKAKKRDRVVWRGLVSMERDEAFEMVNRIAWAAENVALVWEEVDHFVGSGRLPPWAFRLVNEGRHRNVRILACARRPANVSRDLTANASRLIVFTTTEPRDLKYLREYVGEVADELPHLDQYGALDWTEAGARLRKSPFG